MPPALTCPWDEARIDAALREMFVALCAQPLPGRLLSIAEQLDDADEVEARSPRLGVG
jgi:hypothetical protein